MADSLLQSTAARVEFKAYLTGTNTEATGKTIAVVISKNGGAFGNPSAGATNATAIGNGWYYADVSTTDTNTIGPLIVRGTEGTIDPAEVVYYVKAAVTAANILQINTTAVQSISGSMLVNTFDRLAVSSATSNTITVTTTVTGGARYIGHLGLIQSGTDFFDGRTCTGFSAPSTFTFDRAFTTPPDNTSIIVFIAANNPSIDSNLNTKADIQTAKGNAVTTTTNGVLDVNAKNINNVAAQTDTNGLLKVDVEDIKGTAYPGTAGYFVDWTQIQNKTATVELTNTTVATVTTTTTATNLTNAPTNGDFTTAMKTSIGTALTSQGLTVARSGYLDNLNIGGAVAKGSDLATVKSEVDTIVAFVGLSTPQTGDVADLIPARLVMTAGKLWVLDDNGNSISDQIPTTTEIANVLFVDGAAHKLQVNSDGSVNATVSAGGAATPEDVEAGTAEVLAAIAAIDITPSVVIPPDVAVASQTPSLIQIIRGDTLTRDLPVMGDISTRTKLVVTAKNEDTDTDSQAVFQVVEGVGLTVLKQSATGFSAADGSLTVTDAAAGEARLVLKPAVTALFDPTQDLIWDAQWINASGVITSPIGGNVSFTADVTRAVS